MEKKEPQVISVQGQPLSERPKEGLDMVFLNRANAFWARVAQLLRGQSTDATKEFTQQLELFIGNTGDSIRRLGNPRELAKLDPGEDYNEIGDGLAIMMSWLARKKEQELEGWADFDPAVKAKLEESEWVFNTACQKIFPEIKSPASAVTPEVINEAIPNLSEDYPELNTENNRAVLLGVVSNRPELARRIDDFIGYIGRMCDGGYIGLGDPESVLEQDFGSNEERRKRAVVAAKMVYKLQLIRESL